MSSHPTSGLKLWGQAVYWIPPVGTVPGADLQMKALRSDTATRFEIPSLQGDISRQLVGKVIPRAWEVLGCSVVISACRDAINQSVRYMKRLRRDPRSGGVHTLELQSGPTCALMSMMAFKAGANQVLACDMSSQYMDTNAELANRNGLLYSLDKGSLPGEGVRFTKVHPSKLTSGSTGEADLARPVDILMLPIPEHGLFEGGLLKMIRTVQQNAKLLSSDAVIFPSKITVWAQVVETTESFCSAGDRLDCSALFNLMLSSGSAPPPVDAAGLPHRALSSPVEAMTIDLADVLLGSKATKAAAASCFSKKLVTVQIKESGHATAIVWWWSLDLCSRASKQSLTLTNAPMSSSPWLQVTNNIITAGIKSSTVSNSLVLCLKQDIQYIPEKPSLGQGDTVSLAVSFTEDELGLQFALSAPPSCQTGHASQNALLKFDPHWAGAWAKVRHQQKVR